MTRSSHPVREHILDFDDDFERELRRKRKNPEPSESSSNSEAEVEIGQCRTSMYSISGGCPRKDRGIRVKVKFATPYSEVPWVVHGGS
ncbi:hypothetical protein FF1_032375 [Malus domestica]